MNRTIMLKGLVDAGRKYLDARRNAPLVQADRDYQMAERNYGTAKLASAASDLKRKPYLERAERFLDPNYYLTTPPEQQAADFEFYNSGAAEHDLPAIDPTIARRNVLNDAMWKDAISMYQSGIPEDVATTRLVSRWGQDNFDQFAQVVRSNAVQTVGAATPSPAAMEEAPPLPPGVIEERNRRYDPKTRKEYYTDGQGPGVLAEMIDQRTLPTWAQPPTEALQQAAPALMEQTPQVTAGALKAALPGAEPDAATVDTNLIHALYGANRLSKQEQADAKTLADAIKIGQYHTAAKNDAYGRTPGELIARDWNAMHPGKPVPSYLLTVGPSASTANQLTARDDKLSAEDRKRRDKMAEAVRMGRATVEDFVKEFPESTVPQVSPYAKMQFERGRQANWALQQRLKMDERKQKFLESTTTTRLQLARDSAKRMAAAASTRDQQFQLRMIAAGIAGLKAAGGKYDPFESKFVQSEGDKVAEEHWKTLLKAMGAMDDDGNLVMSDEGMDFGGDPFAETEGGGSKGAPVSAKREVANIAAEMPDSDPNKRKINGILNGWDRLSAGEQKQALEITRKLYRSR